MVDITIKVAVVTGAAQGLGRAIALRLAEDGLDVVITDTATEAKALDDLAQEISARKRKGLAVIGDPSQEADVNKFVDIAVTELGGLDVMVANASIGFANPLISTPLEEWDRTNAVNARGVFLCYRAAALQMIRQGRGGRIIGCCSLAGKTGPAEWGAYSASKFAVRGLTQAAAAELGQYGITVNTYAPGAIDVPRFHEVQKERVQQGHGKISPTAFPLVPPADVAGLVSFLVRDESKFITGQSLNINGGVYFD